MTARKNRNLWRIAGTLLLLTTMVASLAYAWSLAGKPADAAVPTGTVHQPPVPGQPRQPLEGGPAHPDAPNYTTSPSPPEVLDPHWAANVRANTDTTTYAQQEPAVAVNPLNHLNVVVAQKDERSAPQPNTSTKETWIDTSTDGGQTWINQHIPMPDMSKPQQSDPVVVFSDDNSVSVSIIGLSDAGGLGTYTAMVAHSTDGGITWATPAVAVDPGLGGSDKEWLAQDNNPSSPYYHRMYISWTNFSAGPSFVEKWSSDNGATWNPSPGTNYVRVSYGTYDNCCQFSMPVVLPNGNVIVTWNSDPVIAVGKSTDGGQTFINPNVAGPIIVGVNGVPGSLWRLNTIPATTVSPATGTLVTTWADGRNGKDDIYFSRSTDGGTTWSAAARIPHNAAGSSYQVEPWVSAAPNGRFDVIWYDDRDFPSALNTFNIYASHSTDDGATWTGPDEQVSDASTDLNIGIPHGSGWNSAAGDYINVTSMNDTAYAVWTDTRSGTNEDIYSSRYTPGGGTPTPTITGTPPTNTPTRTATSSPTNTATHTPVPTATNTQPPVTETATSTSTPPAAATDTPPPTQTPGGPSATPVSTDTPTALPTSQTPSPTPTACTISFTDVPVGSTFYTYVHCLACLGIINGYPDGTFKPNNNVTRGQLSKIVSNSAGFNDNQTTQMFQDVPVGSTFFQFIGRLASRGYINGYACGGPGEPCQPGNLPYFRPNNPATRGQISKIVSNAAGFNDPPSGQQFQDVPAGSTFYDYIYRLATRNVMQGYQCGGNGEPCVPPHDLPYFRPNNNATRGQTSKIVSNTFFPDCQATREP
jgi:hypothetical protein